MIIPKKIQPNLAIIQIQSTHFELFFYIFGYTLKAHYKNLAIFTNFFLTSGH
jgi:hypothetical protein